MATGIIVGDVMKRGVITATPSMTVKEAAVIMGRVGIGGMTVVSEGKVVGIFTEGDIISDILAKGKEYKSVRIKQIMKHPVRTIPPDTDIEKAAIIMRDLQIERLPVVQRGKLVGIITERDLVSIEPALLELMQIKGAIEAVPLSDKGVCISGPCENCDIYSENLRSVDSKYLCIDCRQG